jgi:hypothetical protein
VDPSNVAIEISSNRPVISLEPALNAQGKRVYTIVFSTNAPNPLNFDGTDPNGTLAADGNQELWTYQLPPVSDVDLTTGAEIPFQDLSQGTFTQITNTPASRIPSAGSTGVLPFVADDNRDATISDDGQKIAFVSTRDIVPNGNKDGNPEIYLYNRATAGFTQATNTQDFFVNGFLMNPIFNENPSLSSDGSVLAFISNADLTGNNNDDGKGIGNAEIYVANYNGAAVSGVRQATKTKNDPVTGTPAVVFSFGRRLSRDGKLLAFESISTDPKSNSTTRAFYVSFVYNIAADSFAQLGPLAAVAPGDVLHFPTFTDYNSSLSPASVAFTSALNFLPDGTFPTSDQDSTGLNPQRASQVFLAPLPVQSTGPFTRLTNLPSGAAFGGVRALFSNSRKPYRFADSVHCPRNCSGRTGYNQFKRATGAIECDCGQQRRFIFDSISGTAD